jgi:hypothetical protein
MLIDSTPQNTVIYVKTSKGLFGPYASRGIAENSIVSGIIPKEPNEYPQIVERLEDGREALFG